MAGQSNSALGARHDFGPNGTDPKQRTKPRTKPRTRSRPCRRGKSRRSGRPGRPVGLAAGTCISVRHAHVPGARRGNGSHPGYPPGDRPAPARFQGGSRPFDLDFHHCPPPVQQTTTESGGKPLSRPRPATRRQRWSVSPPCCQRPQARTTPSCPKKWQAGWKPPLEA